MTSVSDVASETTNPVAFSGTIVPTAMSGSYRLGLLLVTVAMILVPLVYLALIVAVAWLLAWHVTTNTWIVTAPRLSQLRLLGYLTPAAIGATLLFFMVKPILARREKHADPVQVPERDQPVLHALIREICRQVRAPFPSRVYVDCQVNASASLRGGVLGLFRRDLDLTIGLPLVTGLSARQLSGVLAHEFGHFAQGGGMRMTMLIRSINAWLFRVVHERDSWDAALERWSREGDGRVALPMALARGSVWVSRKALAGVTMVGHGVSCYMLRQMEFDADSYEVKIAGSDTFARTFVRLRELSAGLHVAYGQLSPLIESRSIPADMPQLVATFSRRLPNEFREHVEKISGERTGTFDTHPCDADRIAAAQALATGGALIGGDEPATTLFRDFAALSAAVTRHHYERDLGLELESLRLLAHEEAVRGADDRQRTKSAVADVFGARVSITRPLRVDLDVCAEGLADLDATLEQAREAVRSSSLSEPSYRAFEQVLLRRDLAFCAEQLFLAGAETVDAQQFSLSTPTLAGAQSAQARALQELDTQRACLDAFDGLVAQRLALGVLLHEQRGQGYEARSVVDSLNALGNAVGVVVDGRRLVLAISCLEQAVATIETPSHARSLEGSLDKCRARALAIFNAAPIPAGELRDTWQRLRDEAPQLPRADFMQRVLELYWDCLSRLARLVIDAEAPRPASA